ncbi:probable Peroxisomal targeting signal 2 receptor [Saccharomycodes ludwigii]|uniref:Peroxin-7 n=1 Tax=Saccharomycodes ludwigii TaxID=36035 RepID=A0A376B7J6_9ASCO|nr:hypothetical protein SCDLUD_001749 [Saccharomycodes ludwigii]KAH3901963.1 hypothetical protein SCDLUD_001749 [Saccharomycodes ludwigii]SSD60539.1 probable Peroxisomal targeting signal 2 receptor [Saccharomycodes ludwigii]
MLAYHMQNFSGYSVQYSPFFDNKLAVASGANYGLVGNGKLFILTIQPSGQIVPSNAFLTRDGLFDLSWNELNENQVLVAQGDGTLRLFDINLQKYPVAIFQEHKREVYSCNWNLVNKQNFVSSSWDGTCKIWSPVRKQSLLTWQPVPNTAKTNTNRSCVYQVEFSPHDPNLILSCSGTSHISLKDLRQPGNHVLSFIGHHGMESLTVDFNKYRPHIFCSGGADKLIRIWDMRSIKKNPRFQPMSINELTGHELAIKKVSWSPHLDDVLLSVSYDMTCRVWNDIRAHNIAVTNAVDPNGGCRKLFNKHTEFVTGCDWSLWGSPGFVSTTGWDGNVFIWNALR